MTEIQITPIEIEFMAFGLAIILIRLDVLECSNSYSRWSTV